MLFRSPLIKLAAGLPGPLESPWDRFPNLSPLRLNQKTTAGRDQKTQDGEGESPYEPPLGVHPRNGVGWVQNTPRGSPDLCVRRGIGFPT